MTIELNRTTFRRLVQVYLLSFVLLVLAALYEGLNSAYAAFSADFDKLNSQHFGELSANQLYVTLSVGVPALIAHLAASFALLRFRRWARWLFWTPLILAIPFGLLPGFEVYWTGFWTSWVTFLGSALFGMIILLSYSRDHGVLWFSKDNDVKSE